MVEPPEERRAQAAWRIERPGRRTKEAVRPDVAHVVIRLLRVGGQGRSRQRAPDVEPAESREAVEAGRLDVDWARAHEIEELRDAEPRSHCPDPRGNAGSQRRREARSAEGRVAARDRDRNRLARGGKV